MANEQIQNQKDKQKNLTKSSLFTEKTKRWLNFINIIITFCLFAVCLIGSFDVYASKWAIGFSIFLLLGFIAIALWRMMIVHLNNQWNKKQLVFHYIMLAVTILIVIFWMWAVAESTKSYEYVTKYFEFKKQANNHFTLILMGQLNIDDLLKILGQQKVLADDSFRTTANSLIASLWALTIANAILLFSQTGYNLAFR